MLMSSKFQRKYKPSVGCVNINWRGFESLNYWVYMYRTISSGIHMSQVLSAKRVNGSTILGSVEQPISPGTLVLQLTSLRLDLF